MLQFLCELSDRQAAKAVRCRIDFNYALAMELDDTWLPPQRAALPLSHSALTYTTVSYAPPEGYRQQRTVPSRPALLVVVYLRKGETFAQLGAGFEASTTTAWHHVNETVPLLAARSPSLDQALRRVVRDELLYVVLDGT